MERLLDLCLQESGQSDQRRCQVYMVHQSDAAPRTAAQVAEQLRDAGLSVIVHAGSAGYKSQFKRADTSGAPVAVIFGDEEIKTRTASIKWLRSGKRQAPATQETNPLHPYKQGRAT